MAVLVAVPRVCVVAVCRSFCRSYFARPLFLAALVSVVTPVFADGLTLRVVYGVYR